MLCFLHTAQRTSTLKKSVDQRKQKFDVFHIDCMPAKIIQAIYQEGFLIHHIFDPYVGIALCIYIRIQIHIPNSHIVLTDGIL